MLKEWMVNAPNGQFVNLDGVGRMNHGAVTNNSMMAARFPHIFIEIFKEAGPILMEEPAPTVTVIDESPEKVEIMDEVVPVAEIIDEAPKKEVVIEEKKKNRGGKRK